ncbi:2-hydroxyacyl-CoA dehydratase [Cryptosporangium sp. NPDC048952]|uniref:2-hydroxyacyl-CoA dehydratase n=1 Tax=Cryptosporangium sp. NPDC048952 TaxID=3363961 RepID=UPI0037122E5C
MRAYVERYEAAGALAGPVVGVVGGDLPPSLVAGLGAHPVRLAGTGEAPSSAALDLLGAATDAPVLSILTQILDGRFDYLAGLVVCRDSVGSLNLFYVLRGLRLPFPVHLCQVLHLDRPSTVAFNAGQLRRTVDVVGRWVGVEFDADRQHDAANRYAALDDTLRALQQRRRTTGTVRGTTFLQCVGIAATYPPEEARRLVEAVGDEEAPAFRLFYTGSTQHHPDLYRAVEDRGANIVGEDHDWGDLHLNGGPAGPSATQTARAGWTAQEFRACRADALLAVVREHDTGPAWDVPGQRAAVEPSAVCLRQQNNYDDVLDAVDALRKGTA